MTEAERLTALYEIQQAHDTLKCVVAGCPICKRYYAILLERTK